jgi:predicted Zn finger-like uncharacterized protein
MLITSCTHCQARFRVTPQQLNARQGQVRCGRCTKVFNGFHSLERFPDDDTGARLLAAREAQERSRGNPLEEVRSLEEVPSAEDEPAPEGPVEAPPPAPEPARARAPAPRPRPPEVVDDSGDEEITLEPPPREPPSRAWRFGVALLAVILAIEVAYAYRGPIAQRYPVLRPALESVCARVGCAVPWSREEALLKLEDSELLEVPGKPNEIALGARIRNLASVAQDYPHLELTLTDIGGQAALRRVLRPTDYLGRPLRHGEVIPAGAEVAVQLRLETPRLRATGYELLLFYP